MADTVWVRAACSSSSCVEVAALPGDLVAIRDNTNGTVSAWPLIITADAWLKFREGIKNGDFDKML